MPRHAIELTSMPMHNRIVRLLEDALAECIAHGRDPSSELSGSTITLKIKVVPNKARNAFAYIPSCGSAHALRKGSAGSFYAGLDRDGCIAMKEEDPNQEMFDFADASDTAATAV